MKVVTVLRQEGRAHLEMLKQLSQRWQQLNLLAALRVWRRGAFERVKVQHFKQALADGETQEGLSMRKQRNYEIECGEISVRWRCWSSS